jgi:hypothetical protein
MMGYNIAYRLHGSEGAKMLEIAGGVVLGGVVLFLLYVFLPEVATGLKWTMGITLGLAGLFVVGTFLVGGWYFALLLFGHRTPMVWPVKLFVSAVFWSGTALVWDAFRGFAGTLELIELAERVLRIGWLSRWRTRYRLVFEHDGKPVAHAPFKWIARKRAKEYYPTKIQRRTD